MATHLVTGGCGFVGRNMVKRLYAQGAKVLFIDDLSVGTHPDAWIGKPLNFEPRELRIYGDDAVSYTHLRAHETVLDLVCRLLLEKKKTTVHVYVIHLTLTHTLKKSQT